METKNKIIAHGIDFKKGWYFELKNSKKIYKDTNSKRYFKLKKEWEENETRK